MREEMLARRYARAILEIGKEKGILDELESSLRFFSDCSKAQEGDFYQVMMNPVFRTDERLQLIQAISKEAQLSQGVIDVLSFLIEKGRFCYLPQIQKAFSSQMDERLGRVSAQITTAQPFDKATENRLVNTLSKRIGKSVIANVQLDPRLLGGMKAQIGGLLFDASVRGKLEGLEKSLLLSAAL